MVFLRFFDTPIGFDCIKVRPNSGQVGSGGENSWCCKKRLLKVARFQYFCVVCSRVCRLEKFYESCAC